MIPVLIAVFKTSFFNSSLLFSKNWVLNTEGYDTKISVYNGNGSENCIKCELEGVANGFATPSLKLRRPRDLGLEAVPHHKLHYIQTAINQVIIFQTHSLNSNSL